MCFGGGGGDGGAAAAEAERQKRIAAATSAVNAALDNPARQAQIAQIGSDVQALNLDALQKQREDEQRQLEFALARRGLAGGSADTFLGGRLQDRFNEGAQKAAQIGDQAAQQARAQDEATRANIIAQVQGGLSQGSAVQNALSGGQSAIDRASSDFATQRLGDVFAGFADQLNAGAANKAVAAARSKFQQNRFKALNPGVSRTGQVTSIG